MDEHYFSHTVYSVYDDGVQEIQQESTTSSRQKARSERFTNLSSSMSSQPEMLVSNVNRIAKKVLTLPYFKRYLKELKARKLTLTAVLIIIYGMAIDFSMDIAFNIPFAMATTPDQDSCYAPIPQDASITASQIPFFVQNIIFFIAFPVMGWLTDTYIGRGKAVNLSLRLTWLGILLQMISYCIQYGTCGLPVSIAKYGISSVALLITIIGDAGFYSNMLAYALDQMQDCSSAQIRAFVHWLVWGLFVGFFVDYLAFVQSTIHKPYLLQFSAISAFIVITIAVALNEVFQVELRLSWDMKRPRKNPYSLVYHVLKYAYTNKSPELRSAMTYWENEVPSRIDLAKRRYGGPFEDGEPEDVKTFWRIFAVFISFFGFYIPYYVVVNGVFGYIDQMQGATTSVNGYGGLVIYKVFDQQVFFIIPIVELIIIPSFPKIEYFLTNPLKGISLTYVFLCTGVCLIFIINTVAHLLTNNPFTCFDTENTLNMNYAWYSIPLFFTGLADFMSYLFILEFICSQAPANMSGMLLGAFWFVRGFYLNIGAILQVPFYYPAVNEVIKTVGKLTCSFWILLVQSIICIIGVAVNILVGKYYRRRKRDDGYHTVEIVTQYTVNMLERERALSMATRSGEGDNFTIITQSYAA